ncbi:hypothetical protein ACJIZ3_011609 [Penstemon smallii]|uniref:Uncharacterized protein n=1 Tax=Penstemon smallii TaxID=265156 RepID=A0ABD3UN51_9LAMI
MGDRLYEDLEIAMSSYSKYSIGQYDYNEEEEETDGDYEEEEFNDVENEGKSDELACPFCLEDFDVLGLCCHIDADHRMEVKPGICPFCATKVVINMASHVITQHDKLQEKHLRCIKESPSVDSSSNVAAESMLLSFVNNPETADTPRTIEATTSIESSESGRISGDDSLERTLSSTTTNMKNEKGRRCEFVQELVFSTFLDDL